MSECNCMRIERKKRESSVRSEVMRIRKLLESSCAPDMFEHMIEALELYERSEVMKIREPKPSFNLENSEIKDTTAAPGFIIPSVDEMVQRGIDAGLTKEQAEQVVSTSFKRSALYGTLVMNVSWDKAAGHGDRTVRHEHMTATEALDPKRVEEREREIFTEKLISDCVKQANKPVEELTRTESDKEQIIRLAEFASRIAALPGCALDNIDWDKATAEAEMVGAIRRKRPWWRLW